MSTVYTLNGKVLKNAANDKWLAKKEAPAGFVMNGSNATLWTNGSGSWYASWHGPNYPEGYDGDGKHFTVVNNNDVSTENQLMYATGTTNANGGPNAINPTDMVGTHEGTLLANSAYAYSSQFGSYFLLPLNRSYNNESQVQAYLDNLTITIVDP